jgi:hypothetical protein
MSLDRHHIVHRFFSLVANAFLTSDRGIPNSRAIRDGVMPALNAPRWDSQPRINRASEKGKMGTPADFPKLAGIRSTSDAIILIIDCKKLHCVVGEDARVFDTPLRSFDYVFCDHFPHSAGIARSSKPAARRFNPVPCFVESGCEHVNKLGIENRRGSNEFHDFYHRIPPVCERWETGLLETPRTMAAAAAVVCLFRQAIEQTRYWKKVDRCCNGKRDHPGECHSPVRQFCEPTRHTPSHNSTCGSHAQGCTSSPGFSTSLNMVNVENGKQEAQKGRLMK